MASVIPPAPAAKKLPHEMVMFGDARVDNYYWLRDDSRSDPVILAYLAEENDYTDRVMAGNFYSLRLIQSLLFLGFRVCCTFEYLWNLK